VHGYDVKLLALLETWVADLGRAKISR